MLSHQAQLVSYALVQLDGEHPGVGVLGEVAERGKGLLEARERFAPGPAVLGLLPGLVAIAHRLPPHLSPQGMLGEALGMPHDVLYRQPFPGPGLAVRCLGDLTEPRLAALRKADAIVQEEIRVAGLYESLWQAFAVLLPVRSVGVMGDDRTYEETCVIRAVSSSDGMTADWARLPHDVLAKMSARITNEVKGINRVAYDISSKPPSTIEWE